MCGVGARAHARARVCVCRNQNCIEARLAVRDKSKHKRPWQLNVYIFCILGRSYYCIKKRANKDLLTKYRCGLLNGNGSIHKSSNQNDHLLNITEI